MLIHTDTNEEKYKQESGKTYSLHFLMRKNIRNEDTAESLLAQFLATNEIHAEVGKYENKHTLRKTHTH